MINAIQIALSGLSAASKKLAAGASNIANAQTAGSLTDPQNPPYTPLTTVQTADPGGTVHSDFGPKSQPFTPAYDPDSPFADENGVIGAPNVDYAEEAVNLTIAKHAYEANADVIRTASEMEDALLKIFDKKV